MSVQYGQISLTRSGVWERGTRVMALGLRIKQPSNKLKITGLLIALFAFLAQPFSIIGLPTVWAAGLTVAPTEHTINGTETGVSSVESAGYQDFTLSFDYETGELEAGDSLVYGWRLVGGENQSLGTIQGTTGAEDSGHIATPLPSTADNHAVQVYFTNTGTGSGTNDAITVSNIVVNGDAVPEPAATAATNTRSGVTYHDLQTAVDDAQAGDTIRLNENLSLASDVDVTTSVVIDGNGKTITGNFTKVNSSNNSVLSVLADGVTVRNVTVDGVNPGANQLHGVNVYEATAVTVENVTARNFLSGIAYNASTGVIRNVTTENNAWHGINVDKAGAQVTVEGVNIHNEGFADIYVDDERVASVTAPGYDWERSGLAGREHDRVYRLLPPAAACNDSTFDLFTNGSVNGQAGWGVASPKFDQEVVANIYGYETFGCKSLRISNAVTSGSFGDQTFSAPADELAGENASRDHYEASFSFGSTKQVLQPGLSLSVSPDDGTGNRMSYVGLTDTADGIALTFYDTDNEGLFRSTPLGTVDRAVAHTVKFVIDFKDGQSNDDVKIYLDDTLVHTGTTWEDYYRYSSEQAGNGNVVPSVDRLIFRVAGTAAPATEGNGFLFDGVTVTTSTNNAAPTTTINAPTGTVGRTFTVSGVAADDQALNRVYVQLVNRQDNKRYGGTTINLIGKGKEAAWSKTFDANKLNLPDGTYAAHAAVVDMTGKSGSAGWTANFTVDSTAPTISDVRVGNPVSGLAEIRFKLTDQNSINLAAGKTHVRFTHGTNLENAAAQSANKAVTYDSLTGDYVATIDTNSFASNGSGEYWVYIRAEDSLGNAGGYDDTRHIVVDNTAPEQVTGVAFYGANGKLLNGYTNDSAVVVRWDAVNGADKYEYCYYNAISTSPYREANCWKTHPSVNEQPGALNQGEGVHFVKVRAIDAAGNVGAWSEPVSLVYDTTAPDAHLVASNDSPTIADTVTITGWVEDELYIKSHWFEIKTPRGNIVYSNAMNTDAKSHTFTLDLKDGAGDYVIRYVATDRADNRSDSPNYSNSTILTVSVENAPDAEVGFSDPDGETENGTASDDNSSAAAGSQSRTRRNSAAAGGNTSAPTFVATVNNGQSASESQTEATNEDTSDILGTSTTEGDDDGEVAGASDKAGWSWGEALWGGWFAIIAGILVTWLIVLAFARRFRDTDAA